MSLETTSRSGARGRFKRRLDARGVEQPEGGIECLTEVSVVVVVDVPGGQEDADPQLGGRTARMRKAGVVPGQELAENRDDEVGEERLVGGVDQGQQAIAAVGEPVAAP